jgi:uncharacterized protein YajQ (UPF0234 family)
MSISIQEAMEEALGEIMKPLRELVKDSMNRIESDIDISMVRRTAKKDQQAMMLVQKLAESTKSLKARAETVGAAC